MEFEAGGASGPPQVLGSPMLCLDVSLPNGHYTRNSHHRPLLGSSLKAGNVQRSHSACSPTTMITRLDCEGWPEHAVTSQQDVHATVPLRKLAEIEGFQGDFFEMAKEGNRDKAQLREPEKASLRRLPLPPQMFRGSTMCQALLWALGTTKDTDGASVTEVLAASQERERGTRIRVTKGLGV